MGFRLGIGCLGDVFDRVERDHPNRASGLKAFDFARIGRAERDRLGGFLDFLVFLFRIGQEPDFDQITRLEIEFPRHSQARRAGEKNDLARFFAFAFGLKHQSIAPIGGLRDRLASIGASFERSRSGGDDQRGLNFRGILINRRRDGLNIGDRLERLFFLGRSIGDSGEFLPVIAFDLRDDVVIFLFKLQLSPRVGEQDRLVGSPVVIFFMNQLIATHGKPLRRRDQPNRVTVRSRPSQRQFRQAFAVCRRRFALSLVLLRSRFFRNLLIF